jgi:hypothetical protein
MRLAGNRFLAVPAAQLESLGKLFRGSSERWRTHLDLRRMTELRLRNP